MKKNKKTDIVVKLAVIVSIIIIVFSLIFFLRVDEKSFLSVSYYDVNAKLIKSSFNSLSITNVPFSPKLAYFMSITVTVKNNGSTTLSCQPISSFPSELTNAFPTNIKSASPGKNVEWTSNLINISQFIGRSQPIRFNITISCNYPNSTTTYKYINSSGYTDLNFHSICGDGTCGSDETIDTCGIDCVPLDKVNFRAGDLTYPRSGAYAIAYTDTCGSNLTKYDLNSALPGTTCYGTTVSSCPATIGTLLLNQSYNIPGKPAWADPNYKGCLYRDNTNANTLILAWKSNTRYLDSPCVTSGNWGAIRYKENDASSLISDSPIATYSGELLCK